MRLLNTRTGEFCWVDNPRDAHYAILSHVWAKAGDGRPPEQSYQDIRRIQDNSGGSYVLPQLSEKIQRFCKVALDAGFELGWVDSCCIDQSSSSELSEAINSMYGWYRHAGACYAVLHDVAEPGRLDQFSQSVWFKRGWTLQELLAPSVLLFLSTDWNVIDTKQSLASLIETATGIERSVLTFDLLVENVSVARRMSWAASRTTSRVEDEAYSLMGIFGVNMPTIYGERNHAFVRLQEEIIKRIPDQTIFAWGASLIANSTAAFRPLTPDTMSSLRRPSAASALTSKQYLLASSPQAFDFLPGSIRVLQAQEFAARLNICVEDAYQVYTTTSYGIHARFPLVGGQIYGDAVQLALLACQDAEGRLLALVLRPRGQNFGKEYTIGLTYGNGDTVVVDDSQYVLTGFYRVVSLPTEAVRQYIFRNYVNVTDIYITHRPLDMANRVEDMWSHMINGTPAVQGSFEVRLSGWSKTLLNSRGYRVSTGVLRDHTLNSMPTPRTPSVYISSSMVAIRVQVGRCSCELGATQGTIGVLVSSPNATCVLLDPPHDESLTHITSWASRRGVASEEFRLRVTRTGKLLNLRLSFTYDVSGTKSEYLKIYRLDIEVKTPTLDGTAPAPQQTSSSEGGSDSSLTWL